jgi:pyrroline-5-carboxylate reductase
MEKPWKVGLIGAGKAGEAIIKGLLNSTVYTPQDIQVAESNIDRQQYITQTYNVQCYSDSRNVAIFADVVILAVKPTVVAQILQHIKSTLRKGTVVVSIAAGVTLEFLQRHLTECVVIVRTMPNIACSVNSAMIVWCTTPNISMDEVAMAIDVLTLLGETMLLDEKYLDLATGLVGSGPAYLFLIIDALADAGVRVGLPKDIAIQLAAQTALGAAKMVLETDEHPMKLRDMVATPGGTTVEGLLELEKGKVRAVIISAVSEATKKAQDFQQAL